MSASFGSIESLHAVAADYRTRRITRKASIAPGGTYLLCDLQARGCVRHWWLTYSFQGGKDPWPGSKLSILMTFDDAEAPSVEMPVDVFCGVLFGRKPYRVDSAYLQMLPLNAINSYFPMLFSKRCKIELRNDVGCNLPIWFMADWQEYPEGTQIPPYRFGATLSQSHPGEPLGSHLMADLAGDGFVAGFVKGVHQRDKGDAWFHTGGDLWLIDGQTDPHLLRGIGGEDVFGFSFGLNQTCAPWTGAPMVLDPKDGFGGVESKEVVAYRFFGPDPIRFKSSIVSRFGSRANDIDTVVYYYADANARPAEEKTVSEWEIVGPFECNDEKDFQKAEFPESPRAEWPDEIVADFAHYAPPPGPRVFKPETVPSEHGWLDFTRTMRPTGKTNFGTQPFNVSAYALAQIECPGDCQKQLRLGFDDWMKFWINGELVFEGRHDDGFECVVTEPVAFKKGANEVMVKLSNFDNFEWRAWTFSFSELG
jgi:hypothetical protein